MRTASRPGDGTSSLAGTSRITTEFPPEAVAGEDRATSLPHPRPGLRLDRALGLLGRRLAAQPPERPTGRHRLGVARGHLRRGCLRQSPLADTPALIESSVCRLRLVPV